MKAIRRNFTMILLVAVLLCSFMLLVIVNSESFLNPPVDVSVAEDCSTPGVTCDDHGCRTSIGEFWCTDTGQCHQAGKPCGSQGGNPGGGNKCPGAYPTSPACYGVNVGDVVTYNSSGAKCTCAINEAPNCACVPIQNPVRPVLPPPATPPAENPAGPDAGKTCNTGGVCQGVTPGTPLTGYGCTCNNACFCQGNNTQLENGLCLGDSSCEPGLVCRAVGDILRCKSPDYTVIPATPPATEVPVVPPPAEPGEGNSLNVGKPAIVPCGRNFCKAGFKCVEIEDSKGRLINACKPDNFLVIPEKTFDNATRFAVYEQILEARQVLLNKLVNYRVGQVCPQSNSVCESGLGVCEEVELIVPTKRTLIIRPLAPSSTTQKFIESIVGNSGIVPDGSTEPTASGSTEPTTQPTNSQSTRTVYMCKIKK